MQHSNTTPTHDADEPQWTPQRLPLTRPFYANLSEFERQVLDSRQADSTRDLVMEWDPYA